MTCWSARRSLRIVAAASAAAVLAGCAASTEVRQAVEQRQAAEAARPAAGLPAAGPATAIDVGPTDTSGDEAAAPAADTPAADTPAADTPAAPATDGQTAAAPAPGKAAGKTAAKAPKAGAPAAAKPAAAAAGGCTAAAPAGGNGGATDAGVTETTIKIGGTFFNGGFLDKYGQVSENAPRAYFNFINDSGGICGRKIQFVTCDTAGTADGTSGCLNKLANQEKVFMMGPSLDFNLDIVPPTLARLKLPWVGSSGLYAEEFKSPWMFPSQLRGTDVGALITQFSTQDLKLTKLGVSFLNDVAGPECTEQAKKVAAAGGAKVVETAPNGTIETSLDNQVAKLRNAGVEAVLFCNDPVNTVKFIQAAQRVGWKPTFVGGFVLADDVPQAAGNNGKGMYGFSFWDFYKSNAPGVKKYRQITEFYFPQTFHHFYEQATYVGAQAIVDAIRAVGPKLTREALVAQMKKMDDYDTGFGLRLNFNDLGSSTATGQMFKADDSLVWQPATKRFGVKGTASGSAQSQTLDTVALAPAQSGSVRAARRRARR
ncbi:MAG: ABC transporter substrate-binding protein [Sporichthyaceae bacterium]